MIEFINKIFQITQIYQTDSRISPLLTGIQMRRTRFFEKRYESGYGGSFFIYSGSRKLLTPPYTHTEADNFEFTLCVALSILLGANLNILSYLHIVVSTAPFLLHNYYRKTTLLGRESNSTCSPTK